MQETSFGIVYTDLLRPLSNRLLSVWSSKTHSLKIYTKSISMKTIFSRFALTIIKIFSPLSGSDYIFIALALHLFRPVIVSMTSSLDDVGMWLQWGWDVYTATVMSFGILLYFLRRFVQISRN